MRRRTLPKVVACRSPAGLVLVAALLWPVASTAAGLQDEVRRAQQRVEASGVGYRKALLRLPTVSPGQRDILGDVKFVYDPSPRPRLASLRQFGQRSIIVSEGWISLVEDLVRAQILATPERGPGCLHAFASVAASAVKENLMREPLSPPPHARAVPRFVEYVRDRDHDKCRSVRLTELKTPLVDERVRVGLDAALAWAIGRMLALHLDPRDLEPTASMLGDVGNAASTPNAGAPPPSSELKRELAASELRCRHEGADARSIDLAIALRIDLQPGFMAVVAHEFVFDRDADPATCSSGYARLSQFFRVLQASRLPADASVRSASEQASNVWKAMATGN